MNDDIISLLQDLGKENSVDVIANFILRNPDVEDLVAAKMGALLSNPGSAAAAASTIPTTNESQATNDRSSASTSSYLNNILSASLAQVMDSSYKMIFVVNMDLNMGRGKQCAQVAHAALGLFLQIQESGNTKDMQKIQQWLYMGQKKIVVKANNLAQMQNLKEAANKAGLPNLLVSDAGCTQIAPGSKTVLSIFGRNEDLDTITGSLKLL